jgi:acyl-CoA synthetase (AMP-forming)/AMP-acid ligase II
VLAASIIIAITLMRRTKQFKISRDFMFQTDKMAAGLLNLGLAPGDRLGIWSTNASEVYLTFLAAMRAGIIAVSCSATPIAVENTDTNRKDANENINAFRRTHVLTYFMKRYDAPKLSIRTVNKLPQKSINV